MRTLVAVAVAGLLAPTAVHAQALPFAVEARGAFALPTGEWNDEEAIENGSGLGAALSVRATPALSVYAGWDRFSFDIDDDGLLGAADAEAVDAGFRAGLEVALPVGAPPVAPFVQAGAVYNTTTFEVSDGSTSIDFESDRGLGFELAFGLSLASGPVAIRPTVFFRSHVAEYSDFEPTEGDGESTVSYFGFVLGAAFGG